MDSIVETDLGAWIAAVYETSLAELDDPEFASVVTAIIVEEQLIAQASTQRRESVAA